MKRPRVFIITLVALGAFAGNSILCRLALTRAAIDFASFTAIRLISGALMLALVVAIRHGPVRLRPGWFSALALFAYATAFSFAYTGLPAGTGALLLFGAVQATMIILGLVRRERMHPGGWAGFIFALSGLVVLSWPGISTPPLVASVSMISAGIAWGVYSIRGQSSTDPLRATLGNFACSVPFALLLGLVLKRHLQVDSSGVLLAILSGAITSGLGYVAWYAVMPQLGAMKASIIQLLVPVLAAAAGVGFLHERITWRLAVAAMAILGGIALVIADRKPENSVSERKNIVR